jgi:hypothetical protein
MQSVNPSKSFTLGNVCLRDETDVVTIVSDYENLTIDNKPIWLNWRFSSYDPIQYCKECLTNP